MLSREEKRGDVTAELSGKVAAKLRREFTLVAQEVCSRRRELARVPRDLADDLHDRRLLPLGVQVYCPDRGGKLRLAYDRGMRGTESLRDDSTLCLLWLMLTGSYSIWRTTRDVFSDCHEAVDDDA